MHLWKANNVSKPPKVAVPAQEWQPGDLGLLDLYHLQFVLCGSCTLVFAWQRPFVQQQWRMAEMKHLSTPWSSEADDALANMSITLGLCLAFQPLRRCPGFVWPPGGLTRCSPALFPESEREVKRDLQQDRSGWGINPLLLWVLDSPPANLAWSGCSVAVDDHLL